ncbi:UbiA family prenyltransferase [Palleronia abyssalis]|uniref:Decaprenyl-phosphate phosphoribosyltransferase n=1 Tax=Palleronia abyssalis TaxID=1501240 RepID=A0A2R8C0H0_9RHOB|nr:UbiA family prenyltransferase [Palleronia abyssalis]SPJ25894.1 Decaprenyl-phosphate phosphoribosyltransferase [Palleronia abyssalis]
MNVPLRQSDTRQTLLVDLDTLLRTELRFELFWAGMAKDWKGTLAAMRRGGREPRHIDVDTLPFDEAVLHRLHRAREDGWYVVLTGADRRLALRIAAHLDLFDEIRGPGTLPATFGTDAILQERTADPVTPGSYLMALRPHQWAKNLLCFVPLLAAQDFWPGTVLAACLAFLAFSLMASAVYCLNDLLDLAADRAHPRKKFRPFASGAVPLRHGSWMAAGLFAGSAVLALLLGPGFLALLLAYAVLTTAYSLYIKREVVVDICTLAGLYTLRIVAGAVATGIPMSVWLLAFSIFIFFSLAAVKRQAELVDLANRNGLATAGRGYRADDLSIVSMIALSSGFVAVLVLALYLDSPEVLELYGNPAPLWGICGVLLFWVTRMVMKAHRGQMHDDPLVYAIRDGASGLCLAAVIGFALGGVLT